MKTKIMFFGLTILCFSQIIFSQDIDDNRFENYTQRFFNAGSGIILRRTESDYESIVEKVFSNNISARKIYFTGAEYRGNGIFWIHNNGEKEIVLQTGIRYGSKIIWHGENIAEIIIPTGSPFCHSYFFDFEDNKISSGYDFPIYYNIENKAVLIWGDRDFELYNIKTDEILKNYNLRRILGWTASWPYIKYYIEKIEKEEAAIFLYYYDDWSTERKGKIKLEITGKKALD